MTDEEMTKTAQLAQLTIETMADRVVPLAAGAHIGVLTLIDMMREDPSFEAKFQAALKRRLAFYPPAFDVEASIFAMPPDNAEIKVPGSH
jgi:hypothetical protein